MLGPTELLTYWHKGLRNGNWHQLDAMERTFYRAATWYARIRSRIINSNIIAKLRSIADKLKATIKLSIICAGNERAKVIYSEFETNGVFNWVPRLREWLGDPTYIFWLGLSS